jgi:LysM repeat protein
MRTKYWGTVIVLTLAVQLTACSSSSVKEVASPDSPTPPAGDAGTDAVPQPAPEGGQAAGSGAGSTSGSSSGSSKDAPPAAAAVVGSGNTKDYTVQNGDTLMKIAFKTYGDIYQWKKILEDNKDKLTDPKMLKEGMLIKLDTPSTEPSVERNGEKYLIKDGDTLGKISGEVYGTPAKWKQIWENNKQLIHDPNKIFAGFYLYYLNDGSGTNLANTPAGADSSGEKSAPATTGSANSGQAAGQIASAAPSSPGKPTDLNAAAAAMSASAPAAAAQDAAVPAPDAEPAPGNNAAANGASQ